MVTLEVVQGIISSCSVSTTTVQSDAALHHSMEELRDVLIGQCHRNISCSDTPFFHSLIFPISLPGSRLWSSDLAMVLRPYLTTSELLEVYAWISSLYWSPSAKQKDQAYVATVKSIHGFQKAVA